MPVPEMPVPGDDESTVDPDRPASAVGVADHPVSRTNETEVGREREETGGALSEPQQPGPGWIADQAHGPAVAVTAAGSRGTDPVQPDPAQAVIDRALTQLGVRYSWGGGDASGPTVGIRDGGSGDVHGDYHQAGFDCSGLMIYAFSTLGYSLPHSSGAQYHSGRQVPLPAKRPGDMLFWGANGRIHHVALYIGDGQMIEAPYSGAAVRVTPVYYSGIMPHVTRLL